MKPARIFTLGVAFSAGGAAAFLIGPGEEKKRHTPRAVQIEIADVLFAQGNLGPLLLAYRRPIDAKKIAEGSTDRSTVSAPFTLVSAASK
jgi:hypothetical protein